jgi:hypothetical protein
MGNNTQINNTDYYRLPCGKYLEDFIYYKKLNFNMGSALKYQWRAGFKDGESEDKDNKKSNHYIEFEARCRNPISPNKVEVSNEVDQLKEEAKTWTGV